MTDVPVILQDLPTTVRGFIMLGEDFQPCIIINSRLSREQQKRTYRHELRHLRRDEMFNESYHEYGESLWGK